MNLIISQVIIAVVIIGLFAFEFSKDKTKISVKEMAIVAIFSVLTAILYKVVAIKFPPAQPVFVISVAGAVAMSLGILIKPKLALVAGLLTDIIGLLLAAMVGEGSMPFLGFSLTAMLGVYIPSLLALSTKKFEPKILNIMSALTIAVGISIASWYLMSAQAISIDQNQTQLTDTIRYTIILFLIVIGVVIFLINYYVAKKMEKHNQLALSTAHLTFIIIVVEIVCHIGLTSLWINIMYGIPWMIGSIMRIIKAIFILPLNLVIVTLILKYIPVEYKKHLIKEKN